MRNLAELGQWYDLKAAATAGVIFYKSRNPVILTEGWNGALPAEYLKYVQVIGSGAILRSEAGPPQPQIIMDALIRAQGSRKVAPADAHKPACAP